MRVAFENLSAISGSPWEVARGYLRDDLERVQAAINTSWTVSHHVDGTQIAASQGQILGQLAGTLAEQPTGLTTDDDGLLYFVTDYHQLVRWDGSALVWKFAPGHGNGYFRDFGITPQETGWALCNGSSTTYLTVGAASLSSTSFTTPNLAGSPTYKKSAASYSGAIVAASGSTGTGTTGTGTSGGQSNDHTHSFSATSGLPSSSTDRATAGTGAIVPTAGHTHDVSGTTGNTSADHTHSVPGLSVPALGVGSLDMAHLNVLPYFKR